MTLNPQLQETEIDKALVLVLFPFFSLVLIIGFVAFYARGGKPISLKLRGLGIAFELNSIDQRESAKKDTT